MPGLVTEAAAARLRQIMAAGRTTPLRPASIPVPGRRSIVVRCTSATAAGGADPIGAEVYPAVVVNAASDELIADQEELGTIWLTLWDGSVPTVDKKYFGIMTGYFDPDPTGTSDSRPRVFATSGVGSDTAISTLEGSGDTTGDNITVDNTWTAVACSLSVPSSGTYYVSMTVSAQGKVSASPGSSIHARVFDVTAGAAIGTNAKIYVLTVPVVNIDIVGSSTLTMFASLTSGNSLRIEALRTAGSTWTTSTIWGSTQQVLTRLNIQKIN